jgi:hypothetical protein
LIVSTSLRFGVLSRLTAFVAVSNAPSRAPGAPREVIQSVELPADWVEPEPSLSPYAIEYTRILASQRGSAADRAAHQPAPGLESAPVTAHTGSGPTGYADAPVSALPPPRAHAPSMPDDHGAAPGAPAPPMPDDHGAPPEAVASPMSSAPATMSSAAPPLPSAAPPLPSAAPPLPSAAPPMQAGYGAPGAAPPQMPSGSDQPRAARPPGGYAGQPPWPPAPQPPTPWSSPPKGGRRPSGRGGYLGAAGAVAAAVVLGVTVFGASVLVQNHGSTPTGSTTASPTSRSATAVDPRTGARLTVTVTPQGTGSDVNTQVSGIPGGVAVRLVVVGRDGARHEIDQWVMNGSGSARRAATTLRVDEIASVAIEDTAGQVYVSVPIT